jgi:hypothetical protein
LVLVDAIDGCVVEHLTEDNAEELGESVTGPASNGEQG